MSWTKTAGPREQKNCAALIDAAKLIIMDLENNGELLKTDEKRIEVLRNALSGVGGEL